MGQLYVTLSTDEGDPISHGPFTAVEIIKNRLYGDDLYIATYLDTWKIWETSGFKHWDGFTISTEKPTEVTSL